MSGPLKLMASCLWRTVIMDEMAHDALTLDVAKGHAPNMRMEDMKILWVAIVFIHEVAK